MNSLEQNLQRVIDAGDYCGSETYRNVFIQYQGHNIAPPHDHKKCKICQLADKAGFNNNFY